MLIFHGLQAEIGVHARDAKATADPTPAMDSAVAVADTVPETPPPAQDQDRHEAPGPQLERAETSDGEAYGADDAVGDTGSGAVGDAVGDAGSDTLGDAVGDTLGNVFGNADIGTGSRRPKGYFMTRFRSGRFWCATEDLGRLESASRWLTGQGLAIFVEDRLTKVQPTTVDVLHPEVLHYLQEWEDGLAIGDAAGARNGKESVLGHLEQVR